ncbi:UDP-4-amino-4,6-dideoxy-N-acetyl-beta-L-altrosamine transaminase [Roseimaritima sediminicola]|uniref:UDP-4-amino-4, 6-dideoxy-N-acetyl-beta-L-altrosamine transaminase n=1 Tax=Roseimaritima sediminicola TaxID=2662066 RepID=UPI00192A6483|nr:UDP-4-amino-4,6-dideoxy-N-acetyl-beta-L-altrosamine transaminase [Roseimaritima sediminicola]
MNMIPYGRQSISPADIDAVSECLWSGWLTTGPAVQEFEEAFARRVGAKHAVAVCNATAALHLAMLAAEIGPGDRVITSPNTFLSSANCAAFVGATPDFADIDPVSYTLCPKSLEASWQDDVKAVVAVDYAGQTADMPAIADVVRRRGAVVIEDACHATGGRFEHNGKTYSVGGHPWADMTVFSFHPVKTMTTGEGGMLVTDNDVYANRARSLRSHGMTRDPQSFSGLGDDGPEERGPWYYEMHDLGFNYRITDLQCAIGLSQLTRLDEFTEKRRRLVKQYNDGLADVPAIETPRLRNSNDADLTSWHLYTVQIDFESLGVSRTELMRSLADAGIGSQVLYIPVHLQPWYRRQYGYTTGKCPAAEALYTRSLSLPLFPELAESEQDHIIDTTLQLCTPPRTAAHR